MPRASDSFQHGSILFEFSVSFGFFFFFKCPEIFSLSSVAIQTQREINILKIQISESEFTVRDFEHTAFV